MEKRLSDLDPSDIEIKKGAEIIKKNKKVFSEISKISKDFSIQNKWEQNRMIIQLLPIYRITLML
jgi:hypothetical protein